MRYIFKSYNISKKQLNLKQFIGLTIILIMSLSVFLIIKFNQKLNRNLVDIAQLEVKRFTYELITEKIDNNILNQNNLSDLLVINKNKNDEILLVNFNLDKAYKVLDNVSLILTNTLKNIEDANISTIYLDKSLSHQANSLILSIPMGSILNSQYFYNLGPTLPVKINYIGSILTNLETKITNYGLNNALVELYIYIDFSGDIITFGGHENFNLKYNALIASMMVEGEVPAIYGGTLATQSNIVQKSLN